MQNEEDIFNAQEDIVRLQEEAAQKRKEAAQAAVEAVKKRYSRLLTANDLLKRAATAFGNTDRLRELAEAESKILSDQANALEAQIANLEAVGDTEGADALRDEVADLRMQITEMAQQMLRDAVDAVSAAASKERG